MRSSGKHQGLEGFVTVDPALFDGYIDRPPAMIRRVLLGLLMFLGLTTAGSHPTATDTAEFFHNRLIELEEKLARLKVGSADYEPTLRVHLTMLRQYEAEVRKLRQPPEQRPEWVRMQELIRIKSSSSYRIVPSDMLMISGPMEAIDLSSMNPMSPVMVTVRPDGMIYVPRIVPYGTIAHPVIRGPSAILAAGLTPLELQGVIASKLWVVQSNEMITVRVIGP